MCGSASERTRAISWGEMVIEECPSNPAAVPRVATLLRLLASRPPGRKRLAPLRRRSPCIIRSSPRKRGPRGRGSGLGVPGLASLARDTKSWIPAFAGMSGGESESAAPPSRRQQGAEAAGHGARADARGGVDQALAREPGLEFRRRTALQEIAHGERVMERRALIAEHDVVGGRARPSRS